MTIFWSGPIIKISNVLLSEGKFWKLLKIYFFDSGPDPRDPPNRPGRASPGSQDIVEKPLGIIDFQSRGGGLAGHPEGVQGKTLILNIEYHPKASHVMIT